MAAASQGSVETVPPPTEEMEDVVEYDKHHIIKFNNT